MLYTKRNRGKTFVIVDAAMNDFIRPALYDAAHPVTPARRDINAGAGRVRLLWMLWVRFAKRVIVSYIIGHLGKFPRVTCWCCGVQGPTVLLSRQIIMRGRARPKVLVQRQTIPGVIRRRETRADLCARRVIPPSSAAPSRTWPNGAILSAEKNLLLFLLFRRVPHPSFSKVGIFAFV